MIEVFAVDPEIPASHPDPAQFIGTFAMSRGRLLADYPVRDWVRMMCSNPENTDLRRKELDALACSILAGDARCRLVHIPGLRYDLKDTWVDNAVDQSWAFNQIVSGVEKDGVMSLDSCRDWRPDPSRNISRTPEALAAALMPVLRHAREIRIVDSYFRPVHHVGPQQILSKADRYLDVIQELLGRLKTTGYRTPAISIHARCDRELPSEVWRQGCEEHLPPRVPDGWDVSVLRWRERKKGERFHDRFILTDLGGLGIHGGLDCAPDMHQQTTSINLMGNDEWKKRWADYDPCPETIGNGPFLLEDRVELRGVKQW